MRALMKDMDIGSWLGRTLTIALGAAAGVALAGPVSAADYTLKFAVGTHNDPMHEYMKAYEKCLEPATDDQIDVQIYPDSQLGGVPRMIEGLQFGTIEAMFVAGQHMKGVEKRYGVVDAPGLFSSFEHANQAYWDPSFREPYLNAGKEEGIMGIGIFAYGPSSYQTVEPVATLADFEGLKLRVLATDVERRLMDALGATGLQVDWPDIIPALQRGQIDGVRSNIVIANAQKFYTVAEHATLTNEVMIPVVAFLSTKFFDKLPDNLQKTVLDCGRKVERAMEQVAIDFDANAQKQWKEAGGEIHILSPEDQAELNKRAAKIGEEVFGSDPDLKPLYDALVAAARKHSS